MIGITQTLHPELNGGNILVHLICVSAKIVANIKSKKHSIHGCVSPDIGGPLWLAGVRVKNKDLSKTHICCIMWLMNRKGTRYGKRQREILRNK